ncbi:P-loop containing nucleoside triphosphate hydrolase protein [Chytridium lagenaria]|nr:P-loop containing nucleoside triphosphate hydrolase protein [Chytridium lagenaria]
MSKVGAAESTQVGRVARSGLFQVVVGSGGVGKSCLTVRFLKDEFTNDYDPTIEENYRKSITVDGQACVVNLIDTAGQHEYTMLRDQHLAAGGGFLLVFALNDKSTFEELKDTKKVPIVICANKCDLPPEQIEVTEESVMEYTTPLKIPYFRTSAKESINVNESFHELVREGRKMVRTSKDGTKSATGSRDNLKGKDSKAGGTGTAKEGGGGCCTIL